MIYIISNAVNKTFNVLSISFLEKEINQGGMGITSKTLSYLALFSSIPSLLILTTSPFYIPS